MEEDQGYAMLVILAITKLLLKVGECWREDEGTKAEERQHFYPIWPWPSLDEVRRYYWPPFWAFLL